MPKKNSKLFMPLLFITSVFTGVAFFIFVKVSAEHLSDGTADWDLPTKLLAIRF